MNTNRIIYKLLKTLDKYSGREDFSYELISAQHLKISYEKWEQTLIMLQKKGFIEGIVFTQSLSDKFPHIVESIKPMITYEGIQFVEENSIMQKVKEELKMIGELI